MVALGVVKSQARCRDPPSSVRSKSYRLGKTVGVKTTIVSVPDDCLFFVFGFPLLNARVSAAMVPAGAQDGFFDFGSESLESKLKKPT